MNPPLAPPPVVEVAPPPPVPPSAAFMANTQFVARKTPPALASNGCVARDNGIGEVNRSTLVVHESAVGPASGGRGRAPAACPTKRGIHGKHTICGTKNAAGPRQQWLRCSR